MSAPDRPDPALVQPHISNRVLLALLHVLEEDRGPAFVREVVGEAGLTMAAVSDPEGWVSTEFSGRLIRALTERFYGAPSIPGKDDPLWRLWERSGRLTLRPQSMGAMGPILRALGSPAALYRRLPALMERANRTTRATVEFEAPGRAVIEVFPKDPGSLEYPGSCWTRRGLFQAIPGLWGLPPARVEHPRCLHDPAPADRCTYRVAFTPRATAPWLTDALRIAAGAGLGAGAALGLGHPSWAGAALGGLAGAAGAMGWRWRAAVAENRESIERMADLVQQADQRYAALWDEREQLRRSSLVTRKLSGYLAPELVEQILQDPDREILLGGERTDGAVLFLDIAGFTPRCERLPPEAIVRDLNVLFQRLDPLVTRAGGVIDKRLGDGLMAVFVSPGATESPAQIRRRAVGCALGILREMPAVTRALADVGADPFAVRLGLAAGPLVQGNVGSPERLEYTVIGPVVNLAARLQAAGRPGHVAVTADLAGLAEDAVVVEETRVAVKGFSDPVDVALLQPR